LRHACRREYVVVELLLLYGGVEYENRHKKHSLVAALQVLQQRFCFAAVGGEVGGDDVVE
jgi:hypothetical protein